MPVMDEITLQDAMIILGFSYPTMLNMAKEYGRYDASVAPRGRWYLPVATIKSRLQDEADAIALKMDMLNKAAVIKRPLPEAS